jgi:mycothiol synthase
MNRIVAVTTQTVARFLAYCAQHGAEHDSSFLPDAGFVPSPEQPSFLLDRAGTDIGAVSLLRREPYLSAGRGRFAIFHATEPDGDTYQQLLTAIRPHFGGLKSVYLFLPEERSRTASLLTQLGFQVERYSFVMEMADPPPGEGELPAGYEIVAIGSHDEDRIRQYVEVVNRSFAALAGHLDLTPDAMRTWFEEDTYLADGIRMLLGDGVPVGTVTISR